MFQTYDNRVRNRLNVGEKGKIRSIDLLWKLATYVRSLAEDIYQKVYLYFIAWSFNSIDWLKEVVLKKRRKGMCG